jgi:hypothetical protein
VLTYPGAHDTKARAVADTWGKEYAACCPSASCVSLMQGRCDKLLFMSSQPHESLDVVALNITGPETYEVHYEKTVYGLCVVRRGV